MDAILNISIIATLADSEKCIFIRDLYRKVIAKFHLCSEKNNDFMTKTIFFKWRLDAILNILVIATLADPGKCTFIWDLYRKVIAKFHLCTVIVKNNDLYDKNNFFKWRLDAILNIFVRATDADPGKYRHIMDFPMKVCAKFQLCKNHFQTKPFTRALTALCWATMTSRDRENINGS